MMTRAYLGHSATPLVSQIAKENFLTTSIDDCDLELKVREREPQELESALKHAVRLEALAKAVDGTSDREANRRNRTPRDDPLARRVANLERQAATVDAVDGDSSTSQQRENEVSTLRKQLEEMKKEIGRVKSVQAGRENVSGTVIERQPASSPPSLPQAAPY